MENREGQPDKISTDLQISSFMNDVIVYTGTVLLSWDLSKHLFTRLLFSDRKGPEQF